MTQGAKATIAEDPDGTWWDSFKETVGSVFTIDRTQFLEENYPSIAAVQKEYPELFDSMIGSISEAGPDAPMSEQLKSVDMEQVQRIENMLAADPEKTRQVLDTMNNPQFQEFTKQFPGIMGADNIEEMLGRVLEDPSIIDFSHTMQLQSEFPEVFGKMQEHMAQQAGSDGVSLEQIQELEAAIAENPDNARQILQTMKDNPDFMEFATEKFGNQMGPGNIAEVIRNPEMIESGAQAFNATKQMSDDLIGVFQEFMNGFEGGTASFDDLIEGIFEIFQGFVGSVGTVISGSNFDLAQIGQSAARMTGLDADEATPEAGTTPKSPEPDPTATKQPGSDHAPNPPMGG